RRCRGDADLRRILRRRPGVPRVLPDPRELPGVARERRHLHHRRRLGVLPLPALDRSLGSLVRVLRLRSWLAAPSLGAAAVATAVLALAAVACAEPSRTQSAPRAADEPAAPLAAQRHYEARLLASIDAARA